MTNETKADILGLMRAYLVIPAWWCILKESSEEK